LLSFLSLFPPFLSKSYALQTLSLLLISLTITYLYIPISISSPSSPLLSGTLPLPRYVTCFPSTLRHLLTIRHDDRHSFAIHSTPHHDARSICTRPTPLALVLVHIVYCALTPSCY
jgi:hypothetical protein